MSIDALGLAVFVDSGHDELNNRLAECVVRFYPGESQGLGAQVLEDALKSLYQKVEAVADGRSAGYKVGNYLGEAGERQNAFEREIASILASVWHYDVTFTGTELIAYQ